MRHTGKNLYIVYKSSICSDDTLTSIMWFSSTVLLCMKKHTESHQAMGKQAIKYIYVDLKCQKMFICKINRLLG